MKKTIVFLLQNGIGFGHFKLALTISNYFDKERYNIVFLTQAKSTRIFQKHPYKVYNIPPIYSLKTNNEILLVHSLVDRLLNELQPCLVIEDTYPDSFYLNLPSLHYIPKMLIINRLMATEFENYYYDGILGQYNYLLCLKTKEEFMSGITSIEVRNFVAYSEQMLFFENVFNEPSSEICLSVREKYQFRKFEKNVVVNCGAGGWHIGENICQTIFSSVIKAANVIDESYDKIQFILLIGPYSRYIEENLKHLVKKTTSVKFVDFDDNSDALFHEADLVILRPGYNSTMEALAGNGQVLLLPGISYLEEQNQWCEELKKQYGISYVPVDKINKLTNEIVHLLKLGVPKKRIVKNNAINVANQIEKICSDDTSKRCSCVIGLEYTSENDLILKRIKKLIKMGCVTCNNDSLSFDENDDIPIINRKAHPKIFPIPDIVAICADEQMENREEAFYQQRYHYEEQGTIVFRITELIVKDATVTMRKLINILNNSELYSKCIVLDVDESITNVTRIIEFLDLLTEMINSKHIKLLTVGELVRERVRQKLYTHEYGHYRPEITKLTK